MPIEVTLLQWIGDGVRLCPSSCTAMWRIFPCFAVRKSTPRSASTTDNTTYFKMPQNTYIAPSATTGSLPYLLTFTPTWSRQLLYFLLLTLTNRMNLSEYWGSYTLHEISLLWMVCLLGNQVVAVLWLLLLQLLVFIHQQCYLVPQWLSCKKLLCSIKSLQQPAGSHVSLVCWFFWLCHLVRSLVVPYTSYSKCYGTHHTWSWVL